MNKQELEDEGREEETRNESQRAVVAARVADIKQHGGDRRSDQVANLQHEITVPEAADMFNVSEAPAPSNESNSGDPDDPGRTLLRNTIPRRSWHTG